MSDLGEEEGAAVELFREDGRVALAAAAVPLLEPLEHLLVRVTVRVRVRVRVRARVRVRVRVIG